MAKTKSSKDYFGIAWIGSLILAIIPLTSWLFGFITRFKEGKIVAGIIRAVFGFTIVWLLDLLCMIFSHHICRILNV